MLKSDELSNPDSCLNKARDDERLFVLIARDPAAPDVIRYWIRRRVWLGKNKMQDPQIIEAIDCAKRMEDEQNHMRESIAGIHNPAECWHCLHPEVAR